MDDLFRFKHFSVRNDKSALKLGTDAVLLGAAMTIRPLDRRALDIGTGTGVIALMAAQRSSEIAIASREDEVMLIEAIDIDGPSAQEASDNFASSPWAGRLVSYCTPLSAFVPEGEYDLIFSNPPFYDNSLVNPDPRESAARHTQTLSYRDILAFADRHLSPEGHLSMILPSESEVLLRRSAASFGFYPFRLLRICTTPSKKPRRVIVEFSRLRQQIEESSLVLMSGGERTAEYVQLTGDFYL